MKKIEEKLLESFLKRKEFCRTFDKISVDDETKSIFYYNYGCLVFANKNQNQENEKICFCLPSYDGLLSNTTKSRVNAFLSIFSLQVKQKSYEYFCNDKKIKLDTSYTIIQKDGKYDFILS